MLSHHWESEDVIRFVTNIKRIVQNHRFLVLFVLFAIGITVFIRKKIVSFYKNTFLGEVEKYYPLLMMILVGIFILVLRQYALNSLNFSHTPPAGWRMAFFRGSPKYFYLGRILELSPMYFFSYVSLIVMAYDGENQKKYTATFVYIAIILVFWMIWGNFQCRYITAAVVPLMVLSARTQLFLFEAIKKISPAKRKYAVMLLFILIF
jgi:hypothetical protein